jgi:flavin-dependent dehydrogenase
VRGGVGVSHDCDVLVIGAGPAGSAAAIDLAARGHHVIILEREQFPRFRIGESLLPHTQAVLRKLGVLEALKAQPHVVKRGIEVGFGNSQREPVGIPFEEILGTSERQAFNIRGGVLDEVLADAAANAGADVRFQTTLKSIDSMANDDVRVTTSNGTITARWLLDASGQASVVGRHLGTRTLLKGFQNVCYFEHFTHVKRPMGEREGFAAIVMCREGWFWMIPLDEHTTSIGLVMDEPLARCVPVPAADRLRWGIEHCPLMKERMAEAQGPTRNRVVADFSYSCEPYAGPGYFLAGDAAAFIDPVWSTGVSLGLEGGLHAAKSLGSILDGTTSAAAAIMAHQAWVRRYRGIFLDLIERFYDHSFRELIVAGKGPMEMQRGLVTLLAGEVFAPVPWSVRWRWDAFRLCTRFNRHRPLNERIRSHSMLLSGGVPLPTPDAGVIGAWHRKAMRRSPRAWQST